MRISSAHMIWTRKGWMLPTVGWLSLLQLACLSSGVVALKDPFLPLISSGNFLQREKKLQEKLQLASQNSSADLGPLRDELAWSPVLTRYIVPLVEGESGAHGSPEPVKPHDAEKTLQRIEDWLSSIDGMPDAKTEGNQSVGKWMGKDFKNDASDAQALSFSLALNLMSLVALTGIFSMLRTRYHKVFTHQASLEGGRQGLLCWVMPCWHMSYHDMLAYGIGLDCTMLIAFSDLCMRILLQVGLPLFLLTLAIHEFFPAQTHGRDELSHYGMGCTKKESWLYNLHAAMLWYVLCIVQLRIYQAQQHFLDFRFRWLKDMPHPRCRTLLVEGIPPACRSDAGLRAFFKTAIPEHPVTETYVVRNTKHVRQTLVKWEEAVQHLKKAKFKWEQEGEDPDKRPMVHPNLLGEMGIQHNLLGEEVDAIKHYEAQVDALNLKLVKQREELEHAMEDEDRFRRLDTAEDWRRTMSAVGLDHEKSVAASAGFVTFKSRRSAMMALGLQFTHNELEFVTSLPPDPLDVNYEHLQGNPRKRVLMRCFGYFCILVLFFACLPITFCIAMITNLDALKQYPFIGPILNRLPVVVQAGLKGVTASLGMTILMSCFPTILMLIFNLFFSLKGYAYGQHELQKWYYWFLVIFVVLITSVGSSLIHTAVTLVSHPMEIFHVLSANLPEATNFYLNYMTMQWVLHGLNLTRYITFFKFNALKAVLPEEEARQMSEPEDQDYYGIGGRSARFTTNMTIGLVFSQLSPIITFLTCFNFMVCRCVYTYLMVFAETRKPDLGGRFWITKLDSLQYALVIYLLTMTGVFMSRGTAFSATVSLPALGVWWINYRVYKALVWKSIPLTELPSEPSDAPSLANTPQNPDRSPGGLGHLHSKRVVRWLSGHSPPNRYIQPELLDTSATDMAHIPMASDGGKVPAG